MGKLWIIGDSFSTGTSSESWTTIISNNRDTVRLSKNGISEYRIFKIFQDNKDKFSAGDQIIICHTNPFRIFLPNGISYPSRSKSSHTECDLVIGDAINNGLYWKILTHLFVGYFFDEEYYNTQFDLMVSEIDRESKLKDCKIIHMTGFQSRGPIISIKDIFEKYPGDINHLSVEGNILVAERISKLL